MYINCIPFLHMQSSINEYELYYISVSALLLIDSFYKKALAFTIFSVLPFVFLLVIDVYDTKFVTIHNFFVP